MAAHNPVGKSVQGCTRNCFIYGQFFVISFGLLGVCCCPAAAAAAQQYQARPLLLPQKPEEQCGPKVFNNFTKQYRTCAINFYHRHDPGENLLSQLMFT